MGESLDVKGGDKPGVLLRTVREVFGEDEKCYQILQGNTGRDEVPERCAGNKALLETPKDISCAHLTSPFSLSHGELFSLSKVEGLG